MKFIEIFHDVSIGEVFICTFLEMMAVKSTLKYNCHHVISLGVLMSLVGDKYDALEVIKSYFTVAYNQ